jgi:hypothetical protein
MRPGLRKVETQTRAVERRKRLMKLLLALGLAIGALATAGVAVADAPTFTLTNVGAGANINYPWNTPEGWPEVGITWTETGFQDATYSGYVSLTETARVGCANRKRVVRTFTFTKTIDATNGLFYYHPATDVPAVVIPSYALFIDTSSVKCPRGFTERLVDVTFSNISVTFTNPDSIHATWPSSVVYTP